MALTFVSVLNSPVGTPLHVTVYNGAGVQVDPNVDTITWTGLPTGVTVTPDAPGGLGGFVFNSTFVTSVNAICHDGVASGTLTLGFTAPPLKFTSP